MTDLPQTMLGVFTGSVLIVVGLVPGLLEGLAEGVRNAIESFSSRVPVPAARREPFRQPRWLAIVGAALIAATVWLHLSR